MRFRTNIRQTNVLQYSGMTDANGKQTIISSIRLDIQDVPAEYDEEIHAVMRRQQAAKRVAYNRWADGWEENQIYRKLCGMFPKLTSWDVNAAIKTAESVRKSQYECLLAQVAYLTNKIEKFKKKKEPKPKTLEKIAKMEIKLAECQAHLKAGTLPPAIFGGKQLWKKVESGVPGALQQWRDARTDEYYSVGDSKNNFGNRHFRLSYIKDSGFVLEVRVPDDINRAKWLPLQAISTKKYCDRLIHATKCGAMMTVRLIRITPNHYHAFVTLEEVVRGKVVCDLKPKDDETVCGIDLNLDHAAIAFTDNQGQYRGQTIFDYPNLGEMQKEKTEWSVGNLAKEIVESAVANNITAFVLENLNIQQKYNPNSTFNRRTVTFANRQLNDAIVRTALRNGINIKLVPPEYTSWIGKTKYAEMYGISRHLAAAYVIARRGMGFGERLPTEIVKKFPEIAKSVAPKNQKKDGPKNLKLRTWHTRLVNWKENTPRAGKPWILWATLYGIYSKSGARGGVTDGRNYLPCLLRSGGNTPSVTHLETLAQEEQNTVLTRIPIDGLDARPPDKADGLSYVPL